jgi:hypothetical protein
MKNRIFLFGTFINVLAFIMFGCGSSPSTVTAISSSSNGLALDTAIEQAAERIENAFESGTEIALVSVSSPSTQFSEYVLTYLETVLVNNGKLAVVDRSNLDRIREEQGFQLSGEVSDESAKAIGQLLGAGAIVTGGLVNLGDAYRLNLKAINVETARIGASYAGDIASTQRIQTLLASGGGTATGGGTGSRTQTAQVGSTGSGTAAVPVDPAQPATPTEPKVGDRGPAGGIIFYDKGIFFDGWRYLEAAPADLTPAQWGGRVDGNGTGTAVGAGKRNTELIVERSGADITAAKLCDDLEFGGYDDWFLPSRDELDLLYKNLKQKNLGRFLNSLYWSSSEGSFGGAWRQSFSDGVQEGNINSSRKTDTRSVRAIRQF